MRKSAHLHITWQRRMAFPSNFSFQLLMIDRSVVNYGSDKTVRESPKGKVF